MSEPSATRAAAGTEQAHGPEPAGKGWCGLTLLAILFALLVAPMIALESRRTDIPPPKRSGYPSEVMDQDLYHWIVVQDMESLWPMANIVEYDSATTPGYHWIMAGVLRLTGSRPALLVVNALFALGLVAALWWGMAGVVGGWRAAALAAPAMCSPYVLGSSIWMTTDNAALLPVTTVLSLAALRRFTAKRAAWMGAAQTGAVLVRQIHVWPVALIALAGLLRSPLSRFAPGALRDETRQAPRNWRHPLAAAIAVTVPLLVLGAFVWLWGGLVPRSDWIRSFHARGANPSTFALALTIAGAYGLFMLPLMWEQARRVRIGDWGVWLAGGIGLTTGLAPATTFWFKPRAYGWVWALVKRFDEVVGRVAPGLIPARDPMEAPAPGAQEVEGAAVLIPTEPMPGILGLERSPVIALGAAGGAVMILLLYRAARAAGNRAPALMLLLALLGWLCAQTANTMAWQRYFDPLVLIGLAMMGALCVGRNEPGTRRIPRWAWAGPLLLAGAQLLLAGVTTYREFLTKVL